MSLSPKMTKYKIKIKVNSGVTLHFKTSNYEIIDGVLIRFMDEKVNIRKLFPLVNCEIEEINDE